VTTYLLQCSLSLVNIQLQSHSPRTCEAKLIAQGFAKTGQANFLNFGGQFG